MKCMYVRLIYPVFKLYNHNVVSVCINTGNFQICLNSAAALESFYNLK